MTRHFIIVFLRTLKRQWQYSLINLISMAIGLAVTTLILLYVFNEYSYDRFHDQAESLHLVTLNYQQQEHKFVTPTIPAAVGPSLFETFPEIITFCRTTQPEKGYLLYENKAFEADKIMYADTSFFSLFSFHLINGQPAEALNGINKAVLSDALAEQLFGNLNPIGQLIQLNGQENWIVSGVVKRAPQNSSIQFDVLLSFETLYNNPGLHMDWNGGNRYSTFVKLSKPFNEEVFRKKLPDFLYEKLNKQLENSGFTVDLLLEPLKDIHLHPSVSESNKALSNLHIFTLVAFIVLLIACFNFTNISTASSLRRAKEIGIKKVLGATKNSLIRQFLAESVLMSLIAFLGALLLIELILPYYNALIGKNLRLADAPAVFQLSMILLFICSGLVSGIYPAFYLSSFRPIKALKGAFDNVKKRHLLPKSLVFVQFLAASVLISCTLIIYLQLNYLMSFDKGFESDHVVTIALPSASAKKAVEVLKQEISSLPQVNNCGAVTDLPGTGLSMNGYKPEGIENPVMIHVMDVDGKALDVFGIKIINGRNFDPSFAADKKAYLVNETFVRTFNYKNPLGKTIQREGNFPIIGVVKDFHFNSLHEPLKPLIITMHPYEGYYYLVINIDQPINETLTNSIQNIWRTNLPNDPFIFNTLNTYLGKAYQDEKKLGDLLAWFTVIGLLVATMGLFGLAGLRINQQLKELGIRKILGASPLQLLLFTGGNFSLLVISANILAIIPVWLFMEEWLSNFSAHIPLPFWIFPLTLSFCLFLAWISIFWQALQANRIALINVVNYE
ncbi:MAG: ABC transporter permease [Bacteroidales bacterium]|nr:ABC transporter permease [Bacteroidales bacterium]